MDFLDPRKQRKTTIRLFVGYILIGLAVLIATIILLYQAYGFGLGKNGQVVQNGLVFVSSQPGNAQVYVNNSLYKSTTNTRLQLPEASYNIAIKKSGYQDWTRTVPVEGGSVARYDYPLLIPSNLTTTMVESYGALPGLATQSPDRHWVLVQQPGSETAFDIYDISDPKAINAHITALTMPDSMITTTDEALVAGTSQWQLAEWSNDNRHVLLQHNFGTSTEYILVYRTDSSKSVNLTKTLKLTAGQVVSLRNKKNDQYYVFDPTAQTVSSVALGTPTAVTPVLTAVLNFKSYGDDMLLYATQTDAPAGKVLSMLRDGNNTYKIAEHALGGPYLLDLAQYDGDWYVAAGSSADNKVYIYRNPEEARKVNWVSNLVPAQILRVTAPNYLAFSTNTRFIMIENGTSFGVFDAEYTKNYTYASSQPLDAPQTHAIWMDGDRIQYISAGKVVEFDYDYTNQHTLSAAAPAYLPFFDRDYRYLYTLTPPAANGQSGVAQTSLLIPADQ